MNLAKPVKAGAETETGDKSDEASNDASSTKSVESVICVHRMLDPTKANGMKRIRRVS